MPRRRKGRGRQVLDIALEEAEARQGSRPSTYATEEVMELGTNPTLRTSKGTSTEESEITGERVMYPTQKGCEIHLDYAKVNQMQLEGYLTQASVFDMVRLYLAYLAKNKEAHYEGQTSTSVRIKLRSMGFPENTEDTKQVYLKFCSSQGITVEEVEKDLKILETHVRNKRLTQIHALERTRSEAAERTHNARETGCDPEICVIL